ncbi:hypothetical protein VHUM_02344 [Vanrija humicola]|uniref:Fe2OG dioxygenase domain-containing protein n=1 Tax=Vanrija humicola TaxID=5417 RepID=A0A7D8Z3Q5_VANHU|nr:hypothetical protein VHUM_02344 [Vanrija humicola]
MTIASTPATTLPILDLSLLDQGEAAAQRFRDELTRVTHEIGFFYLTGTGVSAELEDRMLRVSRAFFALSEEHKLAIRNHKSPQFRGYTQLGGEQTYGKVDWREQIDICRDQDVVTDPNAPAYKRLVGPNLWPEALPELRETAEEWQAALGAVARKLLRNWAVALGAGPDYFDDHFGDPFTLLKIVRYPGTERRSQGVGAHNDAGVLTLLWVEPGAGGLQVQTLAGEWIDAPALPHSFIVNIGELLELCTQGYLRATPHRVISPLAPADRISVPFFYNPSLDAQFPVIDLPPELKAKARPRPRDPKNPFFELYGWNALKGRLRAHRDVAAIYHQDLLDQGIAAANLRMAPDQTSQPAEI